MIRNLITKIIALVTILVSVSCESFNTSICGYVQIQQLYYFINTLHSSANVIKTSPTADYTLTYNFCHQLQYWCDKSSTVLTASMIVELKDGTCIAYNQDNIQLIDDKNASQGLHVIYKAIDPTQLINTSIATQPEWTFTYACNSNSTDGCPEVTKTTIWDYFEKNSLSYTITIEVIGVLFMVLGIYMYRVTMIILGWSMSFLILLTVQQTVIFIPGVPDQVLSIVMVLTIICSFFVGYVLAYFPKAGLFCMGMWVGLIISLTLNNVALYLIFSNPQNLPLYIVLPVLCVGFGILTVCVKKTFIIFATSLIGAYICLRALSWHLGAFPNEFTYAKQYQIGMLGLVKWQFYLYVIALFILTASSSALQVWLFRKKAGKSNESTDIDQHFNKIQDKMQNQRPNLLQFENIFKKLKNQPKGPRVLKRPDDDMSDYFTQQDEKASNHSQSIDMSDEQKSDDQEEQQNIKAKEKQKKKTDLQQNLLQKGNKRRK